MTRTPAPRSTQAAAPQITLLFIGLMLAMLLAALNQTVLSTALPTIVGELDGVDLMPWVITSYILTSTIVMPLYGRIGDQIDRKSTRLNSSHVAISYAVFCLKKTRLNALGDMAYAEFVF